MRNSQTASTSARRRAAATAVWSGDAMQPIDKEEDMTGFFLHDRLERVDQRLGKNPERFADSNRPKAKKLSMHSLYPVTMKAHSGSPRKTYSGSGARAMP